MDPIITKMLEGVPYSGMGSTLERNALIGVVRNLISEDKHTVDYILSYCESVGYQRQMAEDVFKELTGLSPALIVNNNAYYDMPSYVPNMCIAWGIAKGNKEKAFYIVPFEYGYAVMEKDEVNAPIPTVISATIPEAFIELKKVAKNIQTLDKIITKKLLETEDVQSTADNVHQVNLPYSLSPLQVLKKNFKDKVLSISEFEKQASQLVQSGELTVDEAEDLMTWKQDLIDEDESYANDTLQLDETWKPLNAEDDGNSFEEALLFVEETINNDNNNENESYPLAFEEAERLFGVDAEKLQEEYDRRHSSSKKASSNIINFDLGDTHIEVEDRTNGEVTEQDIKNAIEKENPQIWVNNTDGTHYIMDFSCNINGKKYNIGSTNIKGDYSLMQLWIERSPWDKKQSGIVPTKEIILDDGRKFTVRYNPNEKSITTILQDGKEVGVDMGTRLQILRKLFHKDDPTIVEEKSASKKVKSDKLGQEEYKGYIINIWQDPGLGRWNYEVLDKESGIKISENNNLENLRLAQSLSKQDVDYMKEHFDTSASLKQASKKVTANDLNEWKLEDIFGSSKDYNQLLEKFRTLDDKQQKYFLDLVRNELDNLKYTKNRKSVAIIDNFIKNNYKSFTYGMDAKTHKIKLASKKVTAENMTLDDIEAEDNKDQVTEEIDKINEKPVEEIFSETTPEEYFEDALSEDKVDTINEVVSRCIDKFSEKFKDFDKYNVQILSYNTKVLGDYEPVEDELVEDKELNANAILQVILAIKNKADENDMKKALAVFSVTNGELHWTGTIRGENDQIVAFTEEGLDSLFEVEDIKEEELEDII